MDQRKLQQAEEILVVALARTGDRDAFAELVRRRQQWLRVLFTRLSADAALADDLAQQTFLQAFNSIARIKDPARFSGWLKTIALNVWRAHWRAHRDTSELDDDMPQLETNATTLSHDLNSALALLAPEPRSCVVLAYHEGMSHEEIARVMDLPLGTVKSHIRRGGEKLRARLAPYLNQTESETNPS